MVGYDIITNKKYQETVPGHTMMFGFTPVKVEYEVADIHDGQITGMTPDGQEKFFNVPEEPRGGGEVGEGIPRECGKGWGSVLDHHSGVRTEDGGEEVDGQHVGGELQGRQGQRVKAEHAGDTRRRRRRRQRDGGEKVALREWREGWAWQCGAVAGGHR